MSSDIYTPFDYSDNLIGFIPSQDHHQYDHHFLRAVSAGSPPEDLTLPPFLYLPLQDFSLQQFQEPLVFPSYSSEEGSMQRSYSTNCMGTGSQEDSPLFGDDGCQGLIRRVHSTGDLQRRSESCSVVMVRAAAERYSSEERKERIEKYRAKRNLRNFNKTIKYACRKTLADSRPRIRGRFARNDEVIGYNPNDNAATPPPPTLHHLSHVDSSCSLWKKNDELSEEEYMNEFHGWAKGVSGLFLPQNYF